MTRVAIVGLGPKGLFALERLLDLRVPDLRIDVFEPHPAPGAGPVYDPAQPAYLRMNYADDRIDAWPADHTLVPEAERPSYMAWRDAQGVTSAVRDYSARADVGRYLNGAFGALLRHAQTDVTVHAQRVGAVERDDDGWTVGGDVYDEVLLATGHEGGTPPVPDDAGPRVAVRGFALTFIDVALALTEGRGGRFRSAGHPYRLEYLPGPSDTTVLPYSRSGRPMLVKPEWSPPPLDRAAWSPRGLRDLVGELAAVAAAALRAVGSPIPAIAPGEPLPTALTPAAELEQSLAVATGVAPPDLPWALGHAWRVLYPEIVAAFSHGGLPARDRPAFRRLAREMERIAFGPPAGNAARVLALIEAGRVDLTHVAGGPVAHADTRIDAVLPPPGATSALIGGLLAAGHVRVADGHRGLDVDPTAACLAVDGTPTQGLSAIGRPTEDAVIGNDTLSRALHPHAGRWAARIAAAVPVA